MSFVDSAVAPIRAVLECLWGEVHPKCASGEGAESVMPINQTEPMVQVGQQ